MAPSTKTTYQERMERLTDDERAAHLAQARGYQRKHRERPLLTVTQRVQRLGEAFPLLDLMTIMSQSTAKLHALEQFEVTMSIENLNSKIQEHEDIIDGLQSDNTKLENANVGIEAQILTFARECRSVKSKNTNQIRINNANINHAQQPLPRWANDLNELNQKSNFLGSALTDHANLPFASGPLVDVQAFLAPNGINQVVYWEAKQCLSKLRIAKHFGLEHNEEFKAKWDTSSQFTKDFPAWQAIRTGRATQKELQHRFVAYVFPGQEYKSLATVTTQLLALPIIPAQPPSTPINVDDIAKVEDLDALIARLSARKQILTASEKKRTFSTPTKLGLEEPSPILSSAGSRKKRPRTGD